MYCMKCGKELKDGENCSCEKEVKVEEQVNEQKESNEKNQEVVKNSVFTNLVKNFGMIFAKPSCAIEDAVNNKRWVNALVYVAIFSILVSLFSTFSMVFNTLKYYNLAVSSAQESYNEAIDKYSESSTVVKIYKRALDNAKENRIEALTNVKFILKVIGNFVKNFIIPILSVLLVSVLLLAMGKMFNGEGSFSQIFAGIGLSYNIQYISLIITLIAKIPFLTHISAATTGITVVYGILAFLVFKESFKLDDNKNVLAVFVSFAITLVVSSFILAI